MKVKIRGIEGTLASMEETGTKIEHSVEKCVYDVELYDREKKASYSFEDVEEYEIIFIDQPVWRDDID